MAWVPSLVWKFLHVSGTAEKNCCHRKECWGLEFVSISAKVSGRKTLPDGHEEVDSIIK